MKITENIKKAKIANQWLFFICGLGLSSWAPLVPFAKERLELSDSNLGLLLLLLGGGGMLMMPLSGILTSKFGSRKIMLFGSIIIAFTIPILAISSSIPVMSLTLFLFGGGIGMLDVSMNTHGVIVEKHYKKPIFSFLHGLFSVGGLVGALCLSFLIKWGLAPFYASLILSIFILFILFNQQRNLFSLDFEQNEVQNTIVKEEKGEIKTNAWLNGRVLMLGFFCFSFFLIEGAMLDWGAIFLIDVKRIPIELSGMGYASFSIAMAGMRLIGGKIITKLSSHQVIVGGGVIAIIGLFFIIYSNVISLILVGFALVGIGVANSVPVLFSTGGNIKKMKISLVLSVITTLGYSGQLAGPVLLGFIAQHSSLSVAFLFLIITLFIVLLIYISKLIILNFMKKE